jgi:cytoskeletal protein CcmA (bactofilin family)
MLASKPTSTVIPHGLTIIGNVNCEGAVQVNGQIVGDLSCASTSVSPTAIINGLIKARRVVVNGEVQGPVVGEEVVLKSQALVTGDIQSESLFIERGARFEGRSLPELLGL